MNMTSNQTMRVCPEPTYHTRDFTGLHGAGGENYRQKSHAHLYCVHRRYPVREWVDGLCLNVYLILLV